VERDNQVCDPEGLDDLQYHGPADYVSRRVLAVGIVRLQVELGVVARLGRQGRLEPREERSARRWGG
jgi:hypothetical protein